MSDLLPLTAGILGLAIVISMLVATMIKGIVVALPLLQRGARQARQATAQAPAVAGDLPAEQVAVIAAAVAASAGAHHIIHIEDRGRGAVWTAEGRLLHQTSHAISRTPKR